MSLSCPPSSPQSKALVGAIIDIILDTEERRRARTKDNAASFQEAVGKIVGDLLVVSCSLTSCLQRKANWIQDIQVDS